ncbi:hypothetical protein TNCV_4429811 [Trichonephila clavipes]|nr:hypothetical protein TNCV_4429811 [Trichonephila clavipes]
MIGRDWRGVPAQVPSSSLDRGSELLGPTPIVFVVFYRRLATDLVILNPGQVTKTTAKLAPLTPNWGCSSPVFKVSDHGRHVMISSPVPLKTRRVGQ